MMLVTHKRGPRRRGFGDASQTFALNDPHAPPRPPPPKETLGSLWDEAATLVRDAPLIELLIGVL